MYIHFSQVHPHVRHHQPRMPCRLQPMHLILLFFLLFFLPLICRKQNSGVHQRSPLSFYSTLPAYSLSHKCYMVHPGLWQDVLGTAVPLWIKTRFLVLSSPQTLHHNLFFCSLRSSQHVFPSRQGSEEAVFLSVHKSPSHFLLRQSAYFWCVFRLPEYLRASTHNLSPYTSQNFLSIFL